MRVPIALAYAAFALSTAVAVTAEDRPLSKVAADFTKKLAAGSIVTGEKVGDSITYSLAGKGEPEGVAPGIAPERRIYEIGSISKVFTGLLLAQASLEGKVSLDTTLRELLGADFPFADENVPEITLRQLSTHTSGLPRLPDNLGSDSVNPYATYDREKLNDFLRTATLAGKPPYPVAYSNVGVGLLGELLSDAYGKSWAALVEEKITQPLGMFDTVVSPNAEQRQRLAPPYSGEKAGSEWTFSALAGAGALRSTAADLILFSDAFLAPEKSPFPQALRRTMEVHAPYPDRGAEIGLGILINKLDGDQEYSHSGGTGGYRSLLQIIPSRKLARVVLINNDAIDAEALTIAARQERLVSSPVAVAGAVESAPIEVSTEELEAFTGVYPINDEVQFTVILRGEHLSIRLTGQPFFAYRPIGKDRFRYDRAKAEVEFHRKAEAEGKSGGVDSLTLFQHGREIKARRSDAPAPKLLFPSSGSLQVYLGEYDFGDGEPFKITLRGETLYAQLTGQNAYPVFQTKPDHFAYDVVEAALIFERDKSGRVTGLILDQDGQQRAKKR